MQKDKGVDKKKSEFPAQIIAGEETKVRIFIQLPPRHDLRASFGVGLIRISCHFRLIESI